MFACDSIFYFLNGYISNNLNLILSKTEVQDFFNANHSKILKFYKRGLIIIYNGQISIYYIDINRQGEKKKED